MKHLLIVVAVEVLGCVLCFIFGRQVDYAPVSAEITKDTNNLIRTSIVYTILFALAVFLKWKIVGIIISAVMIVLALIPVISVFQMLSNWVHPLQFVVAILAEGIPLFVGVFALLLRILH